MTHSSGAKKSESHHHHGGHHHRMVSPLMRKALIGKPVGEELPPRPVLDLMEISFIRAWWWPLLLLFWTLPTAMYIPMTVYNFHSSIYRSLTEVGVLDMVFIWSKPTVEAAVILFCWIAYQGILLEVMPGKKIFGPPTPAGERPEYWDNGVKCWFVTHLTWLVLGPLTNIINFGNLYDVWGSLIAVSNGLTFLLCIFLYWKGRYYPSSRDAVWTGRWAFDFFQGIELHPRLFGLNLKQLLNCRVSMNGWSVAHLCFAQAQYNRGELSTGMIVCVALHVIYLLKFFYWEAGYFASIDIIHDRCGYYIIWGVLCWVPALYCCPCFVLVENPAHWSLPFAGFVMIAGLTALWINYETDLQRQKARHTDGNCLIWGSKPKIIRAEYTTSDGIEHKSLLLASGYWGLSRHFNYVPELTLAFCWSLPAGSSALLGWIYFVFLLILLVDRADRDDEKCKEKYKKYWTEYCQRVPYKILPGIY